MKQILWYGCFPLQYEEQYEEINLVRLVSFNKTVFLRNHWFTTFPTFNWRQFFVTWWKKKAHSSLDELQQPWENQSAWEYMYVPPGNTWCHWSVSLLEFLVFLYQKWCWYKNPDWEYHSRFHQTKSHHLGPGSLWSWTLQRTSKNKQRRKTFFVLVYVWNPFSCNHWNQCWCFPCSWTELSIPTSIYTIQWNLSHP